MFGKIFAGFCLPSVCFLVVLIPLRSQKLLLFCEKMQSDCSLKLNYQEGKTMHTYRGWHINKLTIGVSTVSISPIEVNLKLRLLNWRDSMIT